MSFISSAQTDSAYLHFIYENIREGQSKLTVHYTSNLKPYEIKSWAKKLDKKRIIGVAWPNDYDTLTLTRKERKYVRQQLKASLEMPWPDQLFPDSKRLPPDSIDNYVYRANRVIIDSIMALPGDARRDFFGRYWGFRFSRPIFLRNNSLLIFYLKRYASSSGEDEVKVYRKDGHTWKRWMLIAGSAW